MFQVFAICYNKSPDHPPARETEPMNIPPSIFSSKRDKSCHGRTTRIRVAQKPMVSQKELSEWKKRTATAMLQRDLPEEWSGLRDGMLLPLAERVRQDGRRQDSTRERIFGIHFGGPLIPFGARVSYRHMSSQDESRLHQCGKNLPTVWKYSPKVWGWKHERPLQT